MCVCLQACVQPRLKGRTEYCCFVFPSYSNCISCTIYTLYFRNFVFVFMFAIVGRNAAGCNDSYGACKPVQALIGRPALLSDLRDLYLDSKVLQFLLASLLVRNFLSSCEFRAFEFVSSQRMIRKCKKKRKLPVHAQALHIFSSQGNIKEMMGLFKKQRLNQTETFLLQYAEHSQENIFAASQF